MRFLSVSRILRAAALALACTALPAAADTVTFDNLPDEFGAAYDANGNSIYRENGVRVSSGSGAVAYFDLPGAAHLTDFGTGFASDLMFTAWRPFDAARFSVVSGGYFFSEEVRRLQANILVTGYAGGAVVASAEFVLSRIVGALQTFRLGKAFNGLDRLVIALVNPYDFELCQNAPCMQMNVDSVHLEMAPVPLPSSGAIFAAGVGLLAGLSMIRRRRVRQLG